MKLVEQFLPSDIPWRVHRSEGAFFLWFWFEGLPISSQELYERLRDAGLIAVPGDYFFFGLDTDDWDHARQCLRISIGQPIEVLERGFQILGSVIGEVYR